MAWLQLSLESNRNDAKILSELLEQFGAISVSLSAISDEPVFGQVPESELLWEHTLVTALLYDETDLDTLMVTLSRRVGSNHILKHRIECVADKDWINEFQQNHGVKLFGQKLCICPGWCSPPDNVSTILMLDPGLAFGTGSHDTTGMCLEWLTRNEVTGKTVIDYGCGSGVLALAALKLGAVKAFAVDIDPQALESTRQNAEKNNLLDRIIISLPDNIDPEPADILLANVLLNPLKELAPLFARLVVPQGHIVLSGVLAVQAEECLAAYQSWFNMNPPVFRREWALLEGSRNQNAEDETNSH